MKKAIVRYVRNASEEITINMRRAVKRLRREKSRVKGHVCGRGQRGDTPSKDWGGKAEIWRTMA